VAEQQPFSALPGVTCGRLVRHADSRGAFAELWRSEGQGGLPAVQANLSTSARGVLRGMHLHRHQVDHWIVLSGTAFVALVDARPELASSPGSAITATALMGSGETVTIPEGVAHGFLAIEPLELLYFVTNAYDGSDELGFAWNDPAVGIQWPALSTADGSPILSDRDRANPSLSELVATLRS
jgi:dTDP-4-dehydrorhamnose 3,5-epimerase